ncbi:MAG: hypothetical protein ACFFAT_17560 [Promethearchaeota archaeon]
MNDKKSHKNQLLQKFICIITIFLIILPSFNVFGFIFIQGSNKPLSKIEKIQSSKLEEQYLEKELIQEIDLIIVDKSIQMNFGTATISEEDIKIIYCRLGLIFSIIILEFSVILKKGIGKNRKEEKNHSENCQHALYHQIDQERVVLNSIQEYLQNNRHLEIEKTIQYLKSKFAKSSVDLNNTGIELIVKSLLDKKFIVEGSKLTRGNVLENPNRSVIYEFIKEKPGVHLMKIVRGLNMSNFLVRWHLDMLLKFNYIKCEKISNHEIYYDISINPEEARCNHLIMKDKCSNILNYLEKNDKGSTKYQLAKGLGMHYNTISKYLTELGEYGMIFKKKSNNRILYFLND